VALQAVAEHAQHNNLDTTRKRYMPTVVPLYLSCRLSMGRRLSSNPARRFDP
jgi:hypothetical protein